MNTRALPNMILRASAAALLVGALLYQWPELWLFPVTRFSEGMLQVLCPWLEAVAIHLDGYSVQASGNIHLNMTLLDGSSLPTAIGAWDIPGIQPLTICVVAIASWAAVPATPCRWLLLPVTLLLAIFGAAFVLAVEIQASALQVVGFEWLPSLLFANTEANQEVFIRMGRWFKINQWIKIFHVAGGRLFYGLLAGWIPYTIPFHWNFKKSPAPPPLSETSVKCAILYPMKN